MAPPKGHPRYGGRASGTPNKRTAEEASIFEALAGPRGEAYANQLHAIAVGRHGDPHARLKAIQIIAPYLWRKLPESHEVSGPGGTGIPVTVFHDLRSKPAK